MKPLLKFILILLPIDVAYCACGRPYVYSDVRTFGPECRYKCNCLDNEQCDNTTGECSNGCLRGWMGPACQYRDLATTEVISVSYLATTIDKLSVDGNTETCSKIKQGTGVRYLTVTLKSQMFIVGLTIIIPASDGSKFRSFTIDVSNDTSHFPIRCYAHGDSDAASTVEVNCIEPAVAKYIRISVAEQQSEECSVCEIGIFGGRLISFNQPTSMNSLYVRSGEWYSSYGVDGKMHIIGQNQANAETRTCASTNATYNVSPLPFHWWAIVLPRTFSIQGIRFYGRNDNSLLWQFRPYTISLSADNNTFDHNFEDRSSDYLPDYLPKTTNLEWPINSRVIRFGRNERIIVVCEVEVFADCPYGKCGWKCTELCMCSSQTTGTEKISGTCPYGCTGRYTGQNGKCDTLCSNDKWGPTCNQDCGKCEGACYVTNGTCPGPCKPGWMADDCKQECPPGKYGSGCQDECGKCLTTGTCNRVTGVCDGGCQPGYIEPLCNVECDPGYYGPNCSESCGMCRNGSGTCDHINGKCPYDCASGFQGPTCHRECNKTFFGLDCAELCGKCRDEMTCNNVNGTCSEGCAPGWETTPLCNTPCIDGRYGYNCSLTCGSCFNNSICYRQDGKCPEGCTAGYTGHDCNTLCRPGTYGRNCLEDCGECANNTDCHIETGLCYNNQCRAEWRGTFCKERIKAIAGDGKNIGPIIGGVAGCVAGVAIIVIVILVVLKRRTSSALAKNMQESQPERTFRANIAFDSIEDEDVVQDSEGFAKLEDEYYNLGEPGYEVPNIKFIDTVNLRTECRKARKDPKNIYAEFQAIPYGPLKDASEAARTEYIKKNRYRDLYPYNENRVHLPEILGDSISSYINASYIDGYNRTKKYIAAQGALNTTVHDIWRMIWSEDIAVIAMLTDCIEEGKLKCEKYWPDEGSTQYEHILVDLLSTEEYTDFTIRRFTVTKDDDKEKKTVVQYHYTAWPDKDVPETALSIVQFWRKVREHASGTKNAEFSPWLVHCSAGIGRTGTFIATDILYDQGKNEGRVDVKNCVLNLRYQRLKMVQTKEQYFLLHEILAEILDPIGIVYSNDEFSGIYPKLVSNSATNKQRLYVEYQEICKFTAEMAESHEEGGIYFNAFSKQKRDGEKLENIRKSRESTIIPEDRDRPRLSTAVDSCNDFINAVYIPTYRYKDRMILTQYPLTETVVDFIRMIWQYDITEVVLLENPALEDGMYWSKPKSYQVVGPFKVETLQETSQDAYVLRTLRVSMQGSKQHKEVRQYHFRKWTKGNTVPDNTTSVLQLISDVDNSRGKSFGAPVVVQCLDGAKRCGVFSILYSVLERMKLDRQVAIAETLRLARVKRIQIIESFEQYKYCHDVINEYLRSFDVYANVT